METIQVVCAIIQTNNGYLIARRGKGVHENIWEFPGGKVEKSETNEEADHQILRKLIEDAVGKRI